MVCFFIDYVYYGQNVQYELEINISVLYLQLNNNGGNVVDWFILVFQVFCKVYGLVVVEQVFQQVLEVVGGLILDVNFVIYSNQLKEVCIFNYILSGVFFVKVIDFQLVKLKEVVSECGKVVEKFKKFV